VNEGVMSLLIDSFAAPMFATNCWVLASEPGSECVVIDPGMPDVSLALEEILQRHNLKPVAVIATHGHLDHTFSIQPIADGYAIAKESDSFVRSSRGLARPRSSNFDGT